jgi:hypothetical protein
MKNQDCVNPSSNNNSARHDLDDSHTGTIVVNDVLDSSPPSPPLPSVSSISGATERRSQARSRNGLLLAASALGRSSRAAGHDGSGYGAILPSPLQARRGAGKREREERPLLLLRV